MSKFHRALYNHVPPLRRDAGYPIRQLLIDEDRNVLKTHHPNIWEYVKINRFKPGDLSGTLVDHVARAAYGPSLGRFAHIIKRWFILTVRTFCTLFYNRITQMLIKLYALKTDSFYCYS